VQRREGMAQPVNYGLQRGGDRGRPVAGQPEVLGAA
jgi:hypothetical protein